MKKALAGVLAVALAGVMAGSAIAQVPNVQVYFDPGFSETQASCPGGPPGTVLANLYVVMNNWNMNVTGVDFSIQYPPALSWLSDLPLPDPLTMVNIGASPTGIAIAWANCCTQNGFLPILALVPLVVWGECDCAQGPQPLVVRGFLQGTGLPGEKPGPTAIRREDFVEFAGLGMTSLICPGQIATEQSTWGQVKSLYR
jgi:hypothetical protein